MADQTDLQKAATHVSYEIEMLMVAGSHLGGWHSSPMQTPSGNCKNMALESFLLHYRNLRAFLCPSLQRSTRDDICASHFLGTAGILDVADSKKFVADKVRLDKTLAHLSYERDSFKAGDYNWRVAHMMVEMLEQIEVFLGQLGPHMRSWFPPYEEILTTKSQASLFPPAHNPSSASTASST